MENSIRSLDIISARGRVIERLRSCVKNDTIARVKPRGDGDGRAIYVLKASIREL